MYRDLTSLLAAIAKRMAQRSQAVCSKRGKKSNFKLQMTYLLTALQEIDRSDRSVGKTTGEDTSQTAVRVVLGAVQFKLLGSGHL